MPALRNTAVPQPEWSVGRSLPPSRDPLQNPCFAQFLAEVLEFSPSGTSPGEVIERLGPATWAILPSDDGPFSLANYTQIGLELRWENGPNCLPVNVQFVNVGWSADEL